MGGNFSQLSRQDIDRLSKFIVTAFQSNEEGERQAARDFIRKTLAKQKLDFHDLAENLTKSGGSADTSHYRSTIADQKAEISALRSSERKLQASVSSLREENMALKSANAVLKEKQASHAGGVSSEVAKALEDLRRERDEAKARADAIEKQNALLQENTQKLSDSLADAKAKLTGAANKSREMVRAMQSFVNQMAEGADPAQFNTGYSSSMPGMGDGVKEVLSEYFDTITRKAGHLDDAVNVFHVMAAVCKTAGVDAKVDVTMFLDEKQEPVAHVAFDVIDSSGNKRKIVAFCREGNLANNPWQRAPNFWVFDNIPASSYLDRENFEQVLKLCDFDNVVRLKLTSRRNESYRVSFCSSDLGEVVRQLLPSVLGGTQGRDPQETLRMFDAVKQTFDL